MQLKSNFFLLLSIPPSSKFLCGGTTNSIVTSGRVCGLRPAVSPAANPVSRFDLRRSQKGLQESVKKQGDGNVFGMVWSIEMSRLGRRTSDSLES
jgi:hypothetical protein